MTFNWEGVIMYKYIGDLFVKDGDEEWHEYFECDDLKTVYYAMQRAKKAYLYENKGCEYKINKRNGELIFESK